MYDWSDIIYNEKYKIITKIEKGFSNDKYIIEFNFEIYLLIKPKVIDFSIIDFKYLSDVYLNIKKCEFIRKIYYFDNKTGIYVCEYLREYDDNEHVELGTTKFVTQLKKLHSLKVEKANEKDWILELDKYIKFAEDNNFEFSKSFYENVEYIKSEFCGKIEDKVVFSHGDLTGANILVSKYDMRFIDLEYCCKTYCMWDIAYYCFYQNLDEKKSVEIVCKYYGFNNFSLFKVFTKLVNLICVSWAAQDYIKTENIDSLIQYNENMKRL